MGGSGFRAEPRRVVERDWVFAYEPACSEPGCNRAPTVKIASFWSHGPLREFKNYGLACDEHRDRLLARARVRRAALAVSDDEQIGPAEAIPLTPRDEPA